LPKEHCGSILRIFLKGQDVVAGGNSLLHALRRTLTIFESGGARTKIVSYVT
jgi:hypothetical protein